MKKKIAALFLGVFFAFLLLELGIRFAIGMGWGGSSLNHYMTDSFNPRLVYENKPGITVWDGDILIRINRQGFRGDDFGPKQEGKFRIAAIGDSVTFGQDVPEEEIFVRRLEDLLNGSKEETRFEVLNFGVRGYGLHHEYYLFASKVIHYRPDLVIVGFTLGDLEKVSEEAPENTSRLVVQLKRRLRHSLVYRVGMNRLHLFLQGRQQTQRVEEKGLPSDRHEFIRSFYRLDSDETRILESYFRRWRELADLHDISLLFAIIPSLEGFEGDYPYKEAHEEIRETCDETGVRCVDLLPAFWGKDAALVRTSRQGDFVHPGGEGHRVIAEFLHQTLSKEPALRQFLGEIG